MPCKIAPSAWSLTRPSQCLKSRDHVEKFFIDATLTQLVEIAMECVQQVVDVLVGSLHCRKTAGILASQRFGAGPEEREEEIFPDQRLQCRGAGTHDLRQIDRGPADPGQISLPLRIERQHALADRFVERT